MASIGQIRTALKSTLATIDGLTVYATSPETTNLPCAVIVPRTTNFDGAMGRGLDVYAFDVIVMTSRRDDELAQLELDEYVNGFGSKSIRQVVFQNRSLGIDVDAHVSGMSNYGAQYAIGSEDHVGATLQVVVNTIGTA